jgi:hypothetical protein
MLNEFQLQIQLPGAAEQDRCTQQPQALQFYSVGFGRVHFIFRPRLRGCA